MAKKRSDIPWDEIEKEWRTGSTSNRQLGRDYGVSEAAIRKRVKVEGWQRDLRDKVKRQLKNELIRQDASTQSDNARTSSRTSRARKAEEDREVVRAAAKKLAVIVNKHRTATSAGFTGNKGLQKALNKILSDAKKLKKSLSADDLKILSNAQKQISHSLVNLINSDRRSYDLDDATDDNAPDAISITYYRDKGEVRRG